MDKQRDIIKRCCVLVLNWVWFFLGWELFSWVRMRWVSKGLISLNGLNRSSCWNAPGPGIFPDFWVWCSGTSWWCWSPVRRNWKRYGGGSRAGGNPFCRVVRASPQWGTAWIFSPMEMGRFGCLEKNQYYQFIWSKQVCLLEGYTIAFKLKSMEVLSDGWPSCSVTRTISKQLSNLQLGAVSVLSLCPWGDLGLGWSILRRFTISLSLTWTNASKFPFPSLLASASFAFE